MAAEMAGWSPAFAKRTWAFDFTVLPSSRRNASQLFLDTADQKSVFDVLAAAHPRGPSYSHYYDLGSFSSSFLNSNETFCMLNRQRELTLRRSTAAPTASSSAYV